MKSVFAGACFAPFVIRPVPHGAGPDPVTIIGCVTKDGAGTFVLTDVREQQPGTHASDDAAPSTIRVIYWLSSSKGLNDQWDTRSRYRAKSRTNGRCKVR